MAGDAIIVGTHAAHPKVADDLTVAEVVVLFDDVGQTKGNVNALRMLFESYNEQGGPREAAVN